jgi:hypothetical protein
MAWIARAAVAATGASLDQKMPSPEPEFEEAKKKLELFDLQTSLGLLDRQEPGQVSVSAAALENAGKTLVEKGVSYLLGKGWARKVPARRCRPSRNALSGCPHGIKRYGSHSWPVYS